MTTKFTFSFLLFVFTTVCCATTLQAQHIYHPGQHNIHVGVGYPNLISGIISSYNALPDFLTQTVTEGKGKGSPQFAVSYDYGLTENISAGPYFGYATATTPTFNWNTPAIEPIPFLLPNGLEAKNGKYRYKIDVFSAGLRGVYHFNLQEKIDIYGIGILGINYFEIKELGDQPDASLESLVEVPVPEVSYSGQIGAQYFFSKNLGMYVELGYGMNVLNLGLAVKFDKRKREEF